MSANKLWNPTHVKNFMLELELEPTNWDENIAALAKKGSMSVEEFLETDPITFGEKIWGKDTWKYGSYVKYPKVYNILGEKTYREMLYYYQNTPEQIAVKAYEDAKVAAIKEQKALGLTTWLSAKNEADWEYVFKENKKERAEERAEYEALCDAEEEEEKARGRWALLSADDKVRWEQVAEEAIRAAEAAEMLDGSLAQAVKAAEAKAAWQVMDAQKAVR